MKPLPISRRKTFLLLFCLLAACAPVQTPSALANTPTSQAPTIGPTISLLPTETIGSTLPGANTMKIITLEQKNQTIALHVGESFLLNLGDDIYSWNVVVNDPAVISRVMNIAVVKGAQGIYAAHRIGKTTLVASGDPLCRQAKPPCGMPSILFTLNIDVIT